MAILDFQRPDKVVMLNSDERTGEFEFRPLEPGYGITIGNSLRRILINSLEGFAITSIRIDGVDHEFSTIPGVVEDVVEIVLNLKQVRFKRQIDTQDNERAIITIAGQDTFTAGDIGKYLTGFQVLNPELVICHLDKKSKLNIELTIDKGRGYLPGEENKPVNAPVGTIAIDAIFTPIKNVKYTVENFRVEQKTDYEKLIIEVTTDGSIHPKDALKEAAKILIHHFMLFSDEKIAVEFEVSSSSSASTSASSSVSKNGSADADDFDENALYLRQLLKTKLVDMDLSVRALNCLKAADVETLGDLVSFNKNDLLKFRNFGKKSLTELEDLVHSKNLTFGMNVAKYRLDEE